MEEFEPMSREQLLANKSCCGSGCLNCPYLPRHVKDSTEIDEIKDRYIDNILEKYGLNNDKKSDTNN